MSIFRSWKQLWFFNLSEEKRKYATKERNSPSHWVSLSVALSPPGFAFPSGQATQTFETTFSFSLHSISHYIKKTPNTQSC